MIELSDSEDGTRKGDDVNQTYSLPESPVEENSGKDTRSSIQISKAGTALSSSKLDSEVGELENEGGGSNHIPRSADNLNGTVFLNNIVGGEAENWAGPSRSTPPAVAAVAAASAAIPLETVPPVLIRTPTPAVPIDLAEQTEIHILEIIPDIEPSYLRTLIATHLPTFSDDPVRLTEYVLGVIFERGNDVPRIRGKGKGKRKNDVVSGTDADAVNQNEEADGLGEGRHGKKAKVDWASQDRPRRGGQHYFDMALVSQIFDNKETRVYP